MPWRPATSCRVTPTRTARLAAGKELPSGRDGEHGALLEAVWNVLEDDGMALVLTNAKHVKAVPRRKSDVRDSQWNCDPLCHGLLKASYVPSRAQRELGELERYGRSRVEERA